MFSVFKPASKRTSTVGNSICAQRAHLYVETIVGNGMKDRCPRMVVFFGPDGAGKSTHARRLVRYFRSVGCSCVYVWIRGRHTFSYVVSSFLMRFGYHRVIHGADGITYKVFDPQVFPHLSRIWGAIELLSILPWIVTKIYLARLIGFTVISDRYVPDTLVYLTYWLGKDFSRSFVARVLLLFIPRSTVLFHLDAKVEVLMKRLKYDPATKAYLVFQRKLYPKLAKMLDAPTVDTSDSGIHETFRRILAILERGYT